MRPGRECREGKASDFAGVQSKPAHFDITDSALIGDTGRAEKAVQWITVRFS